MSTRPVTAVFDTVRGHAGLASERVLSERPSFIQDFVAKAQGIEYRNNAPTMGFKGPSVTL